MKRSKILQQNQESRRNITRRECAEAYRRQSDLCERERWRGMKRERESPPQNVGSTFRDVNAHLQTFICRHSSADIETG